jgi:hypothetical protein
MCGWSHTNNAPFLQDNIFLNPCSFLRFIPTCDDRPKRALSFVTQNHVAKSILSLSAHTNTKSKPASIHHAVHRSHCANCDSTRPSFVGNGKSYVTSRQRMAKGPMHENKHDYRHITIIPGGRTERRDGEERVSGSGWAGMTKRVTAPR